MMVNIGDFRTMVEILRPIESRDDDDNVCYTYENIYGENKKVPCKWKNTHGTEAFRALSEGFEQTATVTIRYTPLVDVSCIIRKGGADYEIINLDDINERHAFIELIVKRRVGGV